MIAKVKQESRIMEETISRNGYQEEPSESYSGVDSTDKKRRKDVRRSGEM